MARGVCRWCGAGSVVVGRRGQGVWRGEVFVWQRHRHGAVRRERGAGRVCGAGEATRERRCESVAREMGRGERMGGMEREEAVGRER